MQMFVNLNLISESEESFWDVSCYLHSICDLSAYDLQDYIVQQFTVQYQTKLYLHRATFVLFSTWPQRWQYKTRLAWLQIHWLRKDARRTRRTRTKSERSGTRRRRCKPKTVWRKWILRVDKRQNIRESIATRLQTSKLQKTEILERTAICQCRHSFLQRPLKCFTANSAQRDQPLATIVVARSYFNKWSVNERISLRGIANLHQRKFFAGQSEATGIASSLWPYLGETCRR